MREADIEIRIVPAIDPRDRTLYVVTQDGECLAYLDRTRENGWHWLRDGAFVGRLLDERLNRTLKHSSDGQCTVDHHSRTCRICGVEHSDTPCSQCGGRAFHRSYCRWAK